METQTESSMGEDALVLPLGDRFKDLLHYFLSIDRVYCFLKRTKAPVISLQRISTVYNSLFGTDSFDEEKLKILCMLNNKLMRLRSEERDGMETELVIFEYIKLTAGSDLCAAKRKKSCEESILAYLKDKHRSNSLYSSWDLSRGWHPDFSVDEVELPVPCVVSSNPPSKKVKDPLSTSTTENLMAAIAGNDTAKINEAIEALKRLDFYRNQIQYSKLIPGAKAIFGVLSTPLHPLLQRALARRNIDKLYAHQVKGIEALLSGKHVIVTTGTGSGKSLIYNIPILHSHLTLTSPATALYLFPTKVLAQDQLATLSSLSEGMGVFASTFDGDTPPRERDNLRQRCGKGTVLLTNPDTLHCTLLPGHKLWCDFFSSLKFVVLDEAHTYCGGFGTHVAMVLRRLLRVCASYGCRPQFICCSASVRNPLKLMKSLLPVVALKGGEEGIVVVDQDTSARGNRLLLVWNPHNFVSKPKPHNVAFQNEGSGGVVDVSTNVEKGKRALQLARSPVKSPSKFDGVRESLLPMLKRQRRALKSIPPSADQCLLGLDGGGLESRSVQAFLKGCEDGQGNFSPEGPEVIWQGRKRRKGSAENYPSIDLLSGGIGQSDCPDAGSSSNASSTEEARRLFLFLLLQQTNLRALLFAPSRKLVDSITASCSNDLDTIPSPSLLATSILGYRAGYSSEDRRRVEASMLHGKSIRGIVATSAMELGVDIGDLGATVHLGYCGSPSSFWQQAGRAGRKGNPAVTILVCFFSSVDQYLARHASELLDKGNNDGNPRHHNVALSICNPVALRSHILCAANELPLNTVYTFAAGSHMHENFSPPWFTDADLFGSGFLNTVESLLSEGLIVAIQNDKSPTNVSISSFSASGTLHRLRKAPMPSLLTFNLRPIDPIVFKVVTTEGREIDSMDSRRAFKEAFEGSVFLNQGRTYEVITLNQTTRVATCVACKKDYSTSCSYSSSLTILKLLETKFDSLVSTGSVLERLYDWRYRKIASGVHARGQRILSEHTCLLPEISTRLDALWIDIPLAAQNSIGIDDFPSALSTMAHALLAMAPTVALCTANDLQLHQLQGAAEDTIETTHARILVYETRPGGLGFTEALYLNIIPLLARAQRLLEECGCLQGCLSCILDTGGFRPSQSRRFDQTDPNRAESFTMGFNKKRGAQLLEYLLCLIRSGNYEEKE